MQHRLRYFTWIVCEWPLKERNAFVQWNIATLSVYFEDASLPHHLSRYRTGGEHLSRELEDDKADNLVMTEKDIVSIDSDHAFIHPAISEDRFGTKRPFILQYSFL